jgi:hypothetical protein
MINAVPGGRPSEEGPSLTSDSALTVSLCAFVRARVPVDDVDDIMQLALAQALSC